MALAMFGLRRAVTGTGAAIGWPVCAPFLLLGGFGLGTCISPIFQVVLASVPGRDTGSAPGALQAFRQVGGAPGVAILGQIFFSRLALSPTAPIAHAVCRDAMAAALVYNATAFLAIAVLVWLIPQPEPQG
jgi:hypothetical protein